jgi:hypothetical protein
MISLHRSRRDNRTGGSDHPKLIAEVTLAGTYGSEGPGVVPLQCRPDGKAGIGDAECERAYATRAKPLR